MKSLEIELGRRLDTLRAQHLHRDLDRGAGVDFVSNDYLGLSRHPGLRARLLERMAQGSLGAPSSRLLGGTRAEHIALEARLCAWKGAEAGLLFPSGYQANVALLGCLVQRDDRVLSDQQNHASLIDGLRLAGCHKIIIPHLDLARLEEALRTPYPSGRTFVVTESLFSMDGDQAQLVEVATLCERYGAELVVDDAHATGLYGTERGSGLVEQMGLTDRIAAVSSTCGKAMGCAGAFVTGSRRLIEYLVNRARPFIYSTAISPLLCAAIDAALDVMAVEPERRRRALSRADRLRGRLEGKLDSTQSTGPIVPVLLGSSERALGVAARVRAQGFEVRAIRPPTVEQGSARLRISVHADHEESDIDGLAQAVIAAAEEVPS